MIKEIELTNTPHTARPSATSQHGRRIFVASPAYIATGGPEWVQQIVQQLNKHEGITAYVYYYGNAKDPYLNPMTDPRPHVYREKYKDNPYILMQQEEKWDPETDVFFFPQVCCMIWMRERYRECKKVIIWMSVNYYLSSTPYQLLNYFPPNTICHLAQGQYAKEYLKFAQLTDKTIPFPDCINDTYLSLKDTIDLTAKHRENIISYNPKKSSKIFIQMIENVVKDKGYTFLPLEGYTFEQLINIFTHSKLYLDIGFNPGNDRMPREAAVCGCGLLTSKLGGFKYWQDMPIDEKYKINPEQERLREFRERIIDLVDNYDERIWDFEEERKKVLGEKENFLKGIEKVIQVIR